MFKMIALVLERVEGLVLDLPPRSTSAHGSFDRARIERNVSNPGPTSYFPLLVGLLIEQIVDLNIDCALAQAKIVGPGKIMLGSLWISGSSFLDLSAGPASSKLSSQALV
jgi:hypothetical protein